MDTDPLIFESEATNVRPAHETKRSRPVAGGRDRGAAAVEMALVLPLLLLIIFGLVDFGRGFNAQMQITQAAREAVRVKAMFGTNADADSRVTAATAGLPGTPPAINWASSTTCAAGDTTSNASVKVSYSFTYITPLGPIARLFSTSSTMGNAQTLSSTGVMRCAG